MVGVGKRKFTRQCKGNLVVLYCGRGGVAQSSLICLDKGSQRKEQEAQDFCQAKRYPLLTLIVLAIMQSRLSIANQC